MEIYEVVNDIDVTHFHKAVNNHLNEGWKLCGGVFVDIDMDGNSHFYQAMTRELSSHESPEKYLR